MRRFTTVATIDAKTGQRVEAFGECSDGEWVRYTDALIARDRAMVLGLVTSFVFYIGVTWLSSAAVQVPAERVELADGVTVTDNHIEGFYVREDGE